MSNENRALAEFDTVEHVMVLHGGESVKVEVDYMDYNSLMRVWAKFRELNFEDNAVLEIQFLTNYRQCISAL